MIFTLGVRWIDLELGQFLAEMAFSFFDLQTILHGLILLILLLLLQDLAKDNVIVLTVIKALEHEIDVLVIPERFNKL